MNNKETLKNLVVGFGSQAIILILGLVLPRFLLVNYGSDTNGLTGTITQIFTYLALLEAGIGAAAKNALFKSVSEGNKSGISYWISTARLYYGRVSVYYLIALLLIAFALPFAVKTDVPYLTVVFYILIEGIANVISFYFIGIRTSFLNVSGKTYVTSLITLFTKTFGYITKFVVAYLGLNIVFMQVGYFVAVLIQLLIYAVYMKQHYPWIDYKCAEKDSKLPDRNSYIITEIAGTVFSSTDMIVLSIFVSTSLASVYYVYNMVFSALNVLLNALYFSINYHLGITYHVNIKKYARLHDLYNSIFMGLMTMLMSVAYLLTIPFVSLYTSGISDTNYIYKWLPLLFCLVQMLSWSRYVAGNISGIAGYAKPTSIVSLIEAIINIVLSVVLVPIYGITGGLFATVVALPIKVIYINWLAEKKIMNRSGKKTVLIIAVNYIVFATTILANKFISFEITNYLSFVLIGIGLTVGYFIVTYFINALVNRDMLLPINNVIGRIKMHESFLKTNANNLCCGCTACKSICPQNAISMKADAKGFLYPDIDNELCISCGLCESVCDFKHFEPTTLYPDAYVLKHRNEKEVASSQSGGAFVFLCDYVLENGGYICGCELEDKYTVVHKIEKSREGVNRFKGSKYVQSEMNDTFEQALRLLKEGKLLLFSGTGCQVHGFISLCEKTKVNTANLITCDLICHGCPSIKVWRSFVDAVEKRNKKIVDIADFRNKRQFGWHSHTETFVFTDTTTTTIGWRNNFYDHSMFRESCYDCKYTTTNRKTDFTIGDCWGIEKVYPDLDDNRGLSLVMVRTEKAKTLFQAINSQAIYQEIDLEKVLQPQLIAPVEKGKHYDKFWKIYCKNEERCMRKFFFPSKVKVFFEKCVLFIKIRIKSCLCLLREEKKAKNHGGIAKQLK